MIDDPCLACGAPGKPGAAFCVACGTPMSGLGAQPARPGLREGWDDFRTALKLYGALLAVQVVGGIAFHLKAAMFPVLVFETAAFAFVVAVAAFARRDLAWPPLGRAGFGLLGFGAILLASPLVVGAVGLYVRALATTFGLTMPKELEGFEAHGLPWAIFLIAIAPPLVEELAFRGVIQGALRRHLGLPETLLLQGFAFAILHLSVPSLITHLPLGLYFGWLAARSGSLWPGVFAHFCHNLGVVIAERQGWL